MSNDEFRLYLSCSSDEEQLKEEPKAAVSIDNTCIAFDALLVYLNYLF